MGLPSDLFVSSLPPIAAPRQHGVALRIVRSQPHANLMQSGMRILRCEAQQIAAMEMIGEVIQTHLEFLPRGEQFVLPTRHGSDRARNIFLHRLRYPVR